MARSRSKSGKKNQRPFLGPDQNHERWTNCFARKSTQWDSVDGLLLQEKEQVGRVRRAEKHPMRCCGNSPNKSHMQYCEVPKPGEQLVPTIYGTPYKHAYYHPEPALKTEPPRQSRSRSQPRKVRRSKKHSRSVNKRRIRRASQDERINWHEENQTPQINVVAQLQQQR